MYFFSFILIIYILYSILQKNNSIDRLLIALLLLSLNCVEIGDFIQIGNFSLSYTDLMHFVILISGILFSSFRIHVNKKMLGWIVALVSVCGLSVILCKISPSNVGVMPYAGSWDTYIRTQILNGSWSNLERPVVSNQSFLQLFKMIICFFMTLVVLVKRTDWRQLGVKVAYLNCFIVPLYLFELITVKILKIDIYYRIRAMLMGGMAYSRYSEKLMGLTYEPSHYAFALFLCILLNLFIVDSCSDILTKSQKKTMKISTYIYIILMVLSGAFSVLIYILLLFLIYVYWKHPKKMRMTTILILVPIIVGGSLIVINYDTITNFFQSRDTILLYRLGNVMSIIRNSIIGGKVNAYTSEGTRMTAVFNSILAWISRPLFGIGVGTSYTFSGVVSILESTGLVGFTIWYHLMFKVFPNRYKVPMIFPVVYLLSQLLSGDFGLFYSVNTVFLAIMAGVWAQKVSLKNIDMNSA